MQLSAFADYSLRVLIYVGLDPSGRTSITDVANAYGISRNHVVKVVHRLQALGHLQTFRGRGGGIELGRPPEQIGVGQLVQQLENLQVVECFKTEGQCVLTGRCVLQQALVEAVAAFVAVLDGYTLADLLQPSTRLARALSIAR
jgi:Rrf2 family nitric oxide-sensitive transcriptional repressor